MTRLNKPFCRVVPPLVNFGPWRSKEFAAVLTPTTDGPTLTLRPLASRRETAAAVVKLADVYSWVLKSRALAAVRTKALEKAQKKKAALDAARRKRRLNREIFSGKATS